MHSHDFGYHMGKQSEIAADVSAGKASSLVRGQPRRVCEWGDTRGGRLGGRPCHSSTTYFLPPSVAQQQKNRARGQQMIARQTATTNPIVGPEGGIGGKVRRDHWRLGPCLSSPMNLK